MRRRILRVMLILLLLPPVLAAVAGWLVAPAYLHPIRRELTPDLIRGADASFALTHADRAPFDGRGHCARIRRERSAHRSGGGGSFLCQSSRGSLRLCGVAQISVAREDAAVAVRVDTVVSRSEAHRHSARGSFAGESGGRAGVSGASRLR